MNALDLRPQKNASTFCRWPAGSTRWGLKLAIVATFSCRREVGRSPKRSIRRASRGPQYLVLYEGPCSQSALSWSWLWRDSDVLCSESWCRFSFLFGMSFPQKVGIASSSADNCRRCRLESQWPSFGTRRALLVSESFNTSSLNFPVLTTF